jgi:hypothetical protein
MLALAAETVFLCRSLSFARVTPASFSARLIVSLDSGRLDALYPYCVEAGGATHLDALMVMLVLMATIMLVDHVAIAVVICSLKSGCVSDIWLRFWSVGCSRTRFKVSFCTCTRGCRTT